MILTLPARSAPIDLDPSRTALIVVDMQNDFLSKGGMFDRAGIDIGPANAIVPAVAAVIAAARAAGIPVIYLKQQHAADLSDAGSADSPHYLVHKNRMRLGQSFPAPDGTTGRILVERTWNTEIVDPLKPEPGDIVIGKHRYSGFFETSLDARLRALGIRTLLITGTTTSVCVESTVRDATFRDYRPVVLADCFAEPIAADAARTNHEASLLTIELLFGWVGRSADVIAALGVGREAAE
jgi:ureidoacrylate peracid hydrolase